MQSEAWPGQLSADHAHKLTWRPHHREFIYSELISMCRIKILIRTRAGTRPGRLFARSRISRLAGSIEPGAASDGSRKRVRMPVVGDRVRVKFVDEWEEGDVTRVDAVPSSAGVRRRQTRVCPRAHLTQELTE
eukprot:COSAG02_NODE_1644_length_11524_cov_76.342232_13_plen_133_part_00